MTWITETSVAALTTMLYVLPAAVALATGVWAEHRHGQWATRQEEKARAERELSRYDTSQCF